MPQQAQAALIAHEAQSDEKIALLGQAMKTLEGQIVQQHQLNAEQQHMLNEHSAQINQARGQMGLLKFAIPGVFFVVLTMTGSLLWNKVEHNGSVGQTLNIELTKIQEKLIAETAKLDEHDQSNAAALVRVNTGLTELESTREMFTSAIHALTVYDQEVKTQLISMTETTGGVNESLEELTRSSVELRAALGRIALGVDEHEEELDAVEEKVATMQADSAKIRAAAQSNFAEIETQLRSIVDVENLTRQSVHHTMQMLWQKTFKDEGIDLPEMDFYPENIPAKAMSQVGSMNGN